MRINRGENNEDKQTYHAHRPEEATPPQPAQAPAQPAGPDEQEAYTMPEAPEEELPGRPGRRAKPPKPPKPKKQKKAKEPAYEEPESEEEEAPRRRHFPVGLVVVLILFALIGYGAMKGYTFYQELDGSGQLGPEVTVTVEQGESVAAIATKLKAAGILQYDWLFKQYAAYSGKAGGLQYGDFVLRSGMPYNEMLKTLSVQQVHRKTITLTFPEGSTSVAIAQQMAENDLCSVEDFLACANGTDGSDFSKYDFWSGMPTDNGTIMRCEGYLFPDTYEFFTDDTVYNYVDTFYKEFNAKTADLMDTIAAKGTTLNDVVILGSFIQEEAGKPEEDYKVSAVFHNRLESDDPLWSGHMLESNACSYIMNDGDNNYLWNSAVAQYLGYVDAGAIPEEVLAVYDTYKVTGLPAGAISSPGYDAMKAALNPDEDFMAEGYYFFVTGNPNGDHPGEYFYAKTADEHAQNCVTAGWN